LIGGGSPRVLATAAREANIVGLNFRSTPEGGADPLDIAAPATAQKVDWIKQAAGERLNDLEISIFVPFVEVTDADPRRAAERILDSWRLADKISINQFLGSPQVLVGSVEQLVETIQVRRERFGITYAVIRDSNEGSAVSIMEAFAPIVARPTGW
jgi:alkanesulfonate monooxygenase SsuD/methylene tetrahydromethanopterin reductase-like flavin-dependent oxidoreductase (luciferase family)